MASDDPWITEVSLCICSTATMSKTLLKAAALEAKLAKLVRDGSQLRTRNSPL